MEQSTASELRMRIYMRILVQFCNVNFHEDHERWKALHDALNIVERYSR